MRALFDRFELDPDTREFLHRGEPVHLSPKAFLLLRLLTDAAPRAVSKRELNDAIWPDTFVEECNLAGLAVELRDALGDDARKPRFLRTVHGFGYAFCASLTRTAARERRASLTAAGRGFTLFDGDNIIGRDDTAAVTVDDSTVSRRHACIHIRGDSATITDLGSKNGTWVRNERVAAPLALDEGDMIVVGDVHLRFSRDPSPASTLTLHPG